MAEADWHLKDLLSFYVGKCRSELMSVSEDPVRAESMFEAVRRVREIMILMSCMVGAFTPSEIGALHRLDQIRLVAENESAQMLRIGEDMALLRLWVKSATDVQWNVCDAVRLMRTGRLTNTSAFPEMTTDLLTSVKKPFIVPSVLPANSEFIRQNLRTSILSQFNRAKQEAPLIPDRVQIDFSQEDDSVIIFAETEFKLRGIFDHRRWTVIEAQILDDVAGAYKCRQILQAISSLSIGDMCTALLRMATAQKLKIFQDEAIGLTTESALGWSSVYSVSKAKAGLGNGFVVHLYRRLSELSISASFQMNSENGDFLLDVNMHGFEPSLVTPTDIYRKSFSAILQDIELKVHLLVLGTLLPEALGITYRCELSDSGKVLSLPDHRVLITLTASGSLSVMSSSNLSLEPVLFQICSSETPKLMQTIEAFELTNRVFAFVREKSSEGWIHCAATEIARNQTDVIQQAQEFFALARSTIDSKSDTEFVCAFKKGISLETERFRPGQT